MAAPDRIVEIRDTPLDAAILGELVRERLRDLVVGFKRRVADRRRELQKQREEAASATSAATAMASERGRIQTLIVEKQAVVDDLATIALKEAEVKSVAAAKPATISLLTAQIEELALSLMYRVGRAFRRPAGEHAPGDVPQPRPGAAHRRARPRPQEAGVHSSSCTAAP